MIETKNTFFLKKQLSFFQNNNNNITKWFPKRKGFANAIVLVGNGSILFDQVETHYINPENMPPDKPYQNGSTEKYNLLCTIFKRKFYLIYRISEYINTALGYNITDTFPMWTCWNEYPNTS